MTQYNIISDESLGTFKVESCMDYTDKELRKDIRFDSKLKTYQSDWSGLIEYKLNDYGYRSDINYSDLLFNSKTPYIVAIGCSHTEGIGVKNEDTWIEQLGKKLNLKTMNLGLTSASNDYCMLQYKMMKTIQSKPWINSPKYIFILQPPYNRFGLFNRKKLSFFQEWNFLSDNGEVTPAINYYNKNKNFSLVEYDNHIENQQFQDIFLSNQYFLNEVINHDNTTYTLKWDDFGEDWPLAVDNMHYDKTYHTKIAETFYSMYSKKNII